MPRKNFSCHLLRSSRSAKIFFPRLRLSSPLAHPPRGRRASSPSEGMAVQKMRPESLCSGLIRRGNPPLKRPPNSPLAKQPLCNPMNYRGVALAPVPRVGLEPTQPIGQGILSPSCLPFHHLGAFVIHLLLGRLLNLPAKVAQNPYMSNYQPTKFLVSTN